MILEQIYRNFPKDTIEGEKARMLLFQTHWFTSIAEFDPRTAEALPQTLSAVLWKISSDSLDSSGGLKDRLWRITQHVRSSLENLFRELNESPRREHAILPIRAVRELDTTSFMAVARRPGRNIREKLAGKPYMLAVRRIQSVDLPENQLLKTFSEQLLELLELRSECLGERPDELIDNIYAWLQTDEAQSISYWGNVPPNNTLLTHRDYRAVYDAWCWLQALDDDLTADQNDLERRKNTISQWQTYGQMYANGRRLFAEMPVLFDYDKFSIKPWTEQIFSTAGRRTISREAIYETVPVCIDLTELHPAYSLFASLQQKQVLERKILRDSFLWQNWESSDTLSTMVDINLFNSDALYLHSDTVTVSAPDLFFSHRHEVKHLDRAAHTFVSRLRETFVNKNIVWLRPDFLNDFELTIIRRNINTAYPGAQPLPRSVAAVFEQFDYKQLSNDFAVVVLDCVGRIKCATKLVAKFDKGLKKSLPETRGFYWERHPSVIFFDKDLTEQDGIKFEYDIAILDEHREWHSPTNLKSDNHISLNCLRQNKRIGHFDTVIKLSDSPVVGGIKLFELQKKAGDAPLWRDQIPELSIKGWQNGRYERVYIVDRGTSVKTIRGKVIPIPVGRTITLPAGKDHYQFPLFIGEDEESAGFSIRLESPDFPLSVPLECKLNLKFTYGEDDPYSLVFEPISQTIRPIRVQWTKNVEEIITNAPAPEYPRVSSWNELQTWKDAQGVETDLLKWVIDSLQRLKSMIPMKKEVIITSNWVCKTTDEGTYWYTFGDAKGAFHCYCSTKNFVDYDNSVDPNIRFPQGTTLYCCFIQRDNKRRTAIGITESKDDLKLPAETQQKIIQFKERSLQNRISYVWGDGRSLSDPDCPNDFRENFETLFSYIVEHLPKAIIKRKMRFLQACLHKDTPDMCVTWLTDQVERHKIIDYRAVGFCLGNLSDHWQEVIFDSLITYLSNDSLRVFAYAIWRDPKFVWNFSLSDYQLILNHLCVMLNEITPCPARKNEKDKWAVRAWVRSTTEPLELLLGLLRTRTSSKTEIKMILQPHQKITKELARLVEKVTSTVAESHVTLFSRVQLGNLPPKLEGDRTPDLLYALRLYLTGDDGANAIQITGISDGDAD